MSELDPQATPSTEQSLAQAGLAWPIRALAHCTTWLAAFATQLNPPIIQGGEGADMGPIYRHIPPSLEKSILNPSRHWEQVDIENNQVPVLTEDELTAWGELVDDWYKQNTRWARLRQLAVGAMTFVRDKPSPSLQRTVDMADRPSAQQDQTVQTPENMLSREMLVERLRWANMLACTTSDPRIALQAEQEAEELRYLLSQLPEQ